MDVRDSEATVARGWAALVEARQREDEIAILVRVVPLLNSTMLVSLFSS